MSWVRDEAFENWCKANKVAFTLESRYLKDLNIKASLNNNARLGVSIDEDTVERYAADMRRGDAFPAIIINKNNDIFAGRHRTSAAQRIGLDRVAAYVVDDRSTSQNPSLLRDVITRGDNRRHGLGQTDDEMVHHALVLRERHKMSTVEIARALHVPASKTKWLDAQLDALELAKAMEKLHIDIRYISRGHFVKLLPLRNDPATCCRICNCINEFNMQQDRTDILVRKLKKAKEPASRKAILDKLECDLRQLSSSGSHPTRLRFMEFFVGSRGKCLHYFLTAGNGGKPFKSLNDLGLQPEDIKILMKNWSEVKSIMDKLVQEGVSHLQRSKKSKAG